MGNRPRMRPRLDGLGEFDRAAADVQALIVKFEQSGGKEDRRAALDANRELLDKLPPVSQHDPKVLKAYARQTVRIAGPAVYQQQQWIEHHYS